MRQIIYAIIILYSILIISGCNGNKTTNKLMPELEQAEKVMFDHPDSALHLLESMEIPSSQTDKENHALWCLLTSQAKVKQLMKISSDSLVRIAYDYYKPTDNARRKAMSALYMGDINYELRNIEEAMQYYLEGKTEVEKTDDYKTGYLVMISLCRLYLYRDFADYALEASRKAYDYAVKDSNKRYQLASLKYLARCYCISDSLSKAIDTYHKCSELTLELDLESYYYDIQSEIALVYMHKGDIKKSLEIIKSFPITYQRASLMGKDYYLLGQMDSAYFFLNKALKTDNIYTKVSAYQYLYKLGDIPKYRKYLKTYCDSLLFYNDSIIAIDKGKEIVAYKEKYDHQRLITEQQRLRLEKADAQRMMFIITICLIVVIAVVAYLYQKRLVRKETTIRKQSEQLQDYMLQLHEYETQLMQNNRYMEELKEQLSGQEMNSEELHEYREQIDSLQVENSRLSEKINSLQHHINDYSSKLDKARREADKFRNLSEENLYLKQRERVLTDYVVDTDRLVKELREKCRVLEAGEWETLEQMCESTYSNFVSRLQGVCPTLTKQELHLCILIKLRFSNAQMSEIFGVNTTSVSQKKFRLKKHLSDTLQDGLPDEMTLDRWVAEF